MSSLPGTRPTRFLNSASTIGGRFDPRAEVPSRNDPRFSQLTSLQELFKHLIPQCGAADTYTRRIAHARPEATIKGKDMENFETHCKIELCGLIRFS
jgi:hypothetical protein